MIIFIRGLPGAGKTTVADKVGERLGYEVLHADQFKSEFTKLNSGASFFEQVLPQSYQRTLKELEARKGQNLVVEELFRDVTFIQSVLDFCKENKIENHWFRLKRRMDALNQVENERVTRKIKNSPEILKKMEEEMNSFPIEGEVVIENMNIKESTEEILKHL